MNETNWIFDTVCKQVGEHEIRGLAKAKRMEASLLRKKHRWFKIGNNTKVLIPFKNGKPTEKGLEMIEKYKKMIL